MRLSVIVPVLFAALAVAAPSPASDSAKLVKRYCGNNPPPHPACPKGLYQCFGQCLRCGSPCNTVESEAEGEAESEE